MKWEVLDQGKNWGTVLVIFLLGLNFIALMIIAYVALKLISFIIILVLGFITFKLLKWFFRS